MIHSANVPICTFAMFDGSDPEPIVAMGIFSMDQDGWTVVMPLAHGNGIMPQIGVGMEQPNIIGPFDPDFWATTCLRVEDEWPTAVEIRWIGGKPLKKPPWINRSWAYTRLN